MMQIYAIVNQKGGVGKTTTSVNLAAALAKAGRHVLLIDLDPQANATGAIGFQPPPQPGVYELLLQDKSLDDVVVSTEIAGLDLIASHPELAGAEVELVPVIAREQRLKQALTLDNDRWDVVLIDCPPSLGLLTVNALTAADGILVPLQCEYFALEGLGRLLETVKLVHGHLNPRIELSGILLTMFDARNNICHQVAEEVTSHFGWDVFETVIPRNVRLSEAPSHGLPISVYDPECRGATAYAELAQELMHRMDARLAEVDQVDVAQVDSTVPNPPVH